MNPELLDILTSCRKLAEFLSKFSLGNIKQQCENVIKKIDKYIEDEHIYS